MGSDGKNMGARGGRASSTGSAVDGGRRYDTWTAHRRPDAPARRARVPRRVGQRRRGRWLRIAAGLLAAPLIAAGFVVGEGLLPIAGADQAPLGHGGGAADGISVPDPVEPLRAADAAARDPARTSVQRVRELRATLSPGAAGDDVAALQQRLHDLGYDPGPVDGVYDEGTRAAVWAFQKVHDRAPDGEVTAAVWRDLSAPVRPAALVPDGAPTRVEIDLGRQLLHLYLEGERHLTTHVSTGTGQRFCTAARGCRYAVTPTGDYALTWRVDGWRRSELGMLYNPLYYLGGIAIHGATSVPSHPASRGCVRIPMHIAEYLPSLVERDDPVHVRR